MMVRFHLTVLMLHPGAAAKHSVLGLHLWRHGCSHVDVPGVLPMLLSLFFAEPWSGILFHAETIQRWFLLALMVGKAALVLDHRCCGGRNPGCLLRFWSEFEDQRTGTGYTVTSSFLACFLLPGGFAALALLTVAYLCVPFCFLDFCGSGGEYFLPTDWWPTCQSCVLTPKARRHRTLCQSSV